MGSNGQKGSGLLQKRYRLPPGCSCSEFVMRELINQDRIEAAIRTDANKTSAMPDDVFSIVDEKLNEAVRLALVSVDGEPVNTDGVPYIAMDRWTERTMTFAMRAYQDLNGIDPEEAEDFIKGAEVVTGTTTAMAADVSDPTTAP